MMNATKRVVLNTGFLYSKMLISMFIALYSTRIVLNALGADDYGIFNLVAGVIAMLSFLNVAMATSTQRYMSFYLGAKKESKLNSVFKTSIILHLIIGIIIVLLLEVAGLFLFKGFLNIAEGRISTAKQVYHFMVISTFFTINAVPYDATIIAHEKLLFEAIVGILESVLKLAIAISLNFSQSDRLVIYGAAMAGLLILIRIIKSIYCYIKFSECKSYRKSTLNISLVKEMLSFSGWNMFGALCTLGRSQGIAIILNLFFSTIVNAAYGIAHQVNAQLTAFSTNMFQALNPQIVKSEGSGDRKRMLHLSLLASKYGFFLLAFFSIPLIFEMPYVLKLWLKNVPENTIIFCRLILIMSLINQLTVGSYFALQATGKIKVYQPVTGGLLLLNIPASWLLLKFGYPPHSVLISMIVIELFAAFSKLYFWKNVAGLKLLDFFRTVFIPIFLPTSLSIVLVGNLYLIDGINSSFLSLVLFCSLWVLIYTIFVYYMGTSKQEKNRIHNFIRKKMD